MNGRLAACAMLRTTAAPAPRAAAVAWPSGPSPLICAPATPSAPPARSVPAKIALPSQLRADYCGHSYFFNFGCTISGNTAHENLGTLKPGQTKELTVTFTAKTGFNLWGWHRGHRFTVRVVGSATSFGNWWFIGHRASYSTAYVTIIPRGFWW